MVARNTFSDGFIAWNSAAQNIWAVFLDGAHIDFVNNTVSVRAFARARSLACCLASDVFACVLKQDYYTDQFSGAAAISIWPPTGLFTGNTFRNPLLQFDAQNLAFVQEPSGYTCVDLLLRPCRSLPAPQRV